MPPKKGSKSKRRGGGRKGGTTASTTNPNVINNENVNPNLAQQREEPPGLNREVDSNLIARQQASGESY